jgi:hypothetical protein
MKQATTEMAVRIIYLGGMDPGKFAPVLNAFGPVPDEGQRELAERLVGKVGVYRLEYQIERPRPAVERKRLEDIAAAASRLLVLLEIEDTEGSVAGPDRFQPRSWAGSLLLTELYAVANERRPTTAKLDANERWVALLLLLSDLKEAAVRCAPRTSQLVPGKLEGRGGIRRHGPDPKGRLLQGLFETYAALRGRYPDSGPSVAYNVSLKTFVRTSLALAASSAPQSPRQTAYNMSQWTGPAAQIFPNRLGPRTTRSRRHFHDGGDKPKRDRRLVWGWTR